MNMHVHYSWNSQTTMMPLPIIQCLSNPLLVIETNTNVIHFLQKLNLATIHRIYGPHFPLVVLIFTDFLTSPVPHIYCNWGDVPIKKAQIQNSLTTWWKGFALIKTTLHNSQQWCCFHIMWYVCVCVGIKLIFGLSIFLFLQIYHIFFILTNCIFVFWIREKKLLVPYLFLLLSWTSQTILWSVFIICMEVLYFSSNIISYFFC
jgi:hypothetical protein